MRPSEEEVRGWLSTQVSGQVSARGQTPWGCLNTNKWSHMRVDDQPNYEDVGLILSAFQARPSIKTYAQLESVIILGCDNDLLITLSVSGLHYTRN